AFHVTGVQTCALPIYTGVGPAVAVPVVDDLTDVLDDADYNNDATVNMGALDVSLPFLSWIGDIEADDALTITYSVTVRSVDQLRSEERRGGQARRQAG